MSIFTRTDLPSKKSFSSASLWAAAGSAGTAHRHTTRRERWKLSMRQKISNSGPNLDQRLVQTGALALRTLAGAGHFVLGKHVAAAPAAGRLDADILVGRLGGFEQV